MATTYERGKGITKRTGVDAVAHMAVKMGAAAMGAPKKLGKEIIRRQKAVTDAKRERNVQMIERAFGSVHNYNKLNPMFRSGR